MNPKVQECVGHYLYGAGYYSRDQNTLGLVTGHGSSPPHFCLTCPRREDCENQHEQHVRELLPEEVELFDRLMSEARARGIPPTLAAMHISKKGHDPYMNVAVRNFSEGHADRSRESGALIQ